MNQQEAFGEFIKDKFSFRVSGGLFITYDGNAGFGIQAGGAYTVLPNLVIGGELEYGQFKATFFEVGGVRVKSLSVNVLAQYLFFPKGASPYLAGGYRSSIIVIDTKKIEGQRPGINGLDEVGFGNGLSGTIGFLFPLNPYFSFFCEGRATLDLQVTNNGKTDIENLGGFLGLAGIYFHL